MFFGGLLKNIKKRKPMLANRMGGFLRQRPQLMERMRNLRGMRGMGRNMMMPGMGIGSLARMPSRDVNDLPVPALGVGLPDPQTPLRNIDLMPKLSADPIDRNKIGEVDKILSGYRPGVPDPFKGQPISPVLPNNLPQQPPAMMDMQGRRFMKDGGEAEKYPNAGLAALAKERPDVVKKILGREEGGIMDIQNFPRRSPEMLIDQLNNIIDTDSKYAESVILPNTIFRNNDYENRRKNDPFFTDIYGRPQAESDRPDGVPFFVTNPFSATVLKIIEAIKGVDLRNDPIGIDKVNFLRRRLIDNIKQIEDQGGTVDPDVKAQAMFVERRFKERNMPLTD